MPNRIIFYILSDTYFLETLFDVKLAYRQMFVLQSTPCKHPVIVLQDVIYEDLHALVEFIYHGEVNVHQKALPSFLKTAEVLRVSGLTQQSEVREEVHPLFVYYIFQLRDEKVKAVFVFWNHYNDWRC